MPEWQHDWLKLCANCRRLVRQRQNSVCHSSFVRCTETLPWTGVSVLPQFGCWGVSHICFVVLLQICALQYTGSHAQVCAPRGDDYPQIQCAFLQVPDIDAIIHTSDFSCIKATPGGLQPLAPPIFGYNSDPAHEDVPFPDYSYWGHEYTRLRGAPSQTSNLVPVLQVEPWPSCTCYMAISCNRQDKASAWLTTCTNPPAFAIAHHSTTVPLLAHCQCWRLCTHGQPCIADCFVQMRRTYAVHVAQADSLTPCGLLQMSTFITGMGGTCSISGSESYTRTPVWLTGDLRPSGGAEWLMMITLNGMPLGMAMPCFQDFAVFATDHSHWSSAWCLCTATVESCCSFVLCNFS